MAKKKKKKKQLKTQKRRKRVALLKKSITHSAVVAENTPPLSLSEEKKAANTVTRSARPLPYAIKSIRFQDKQFEQLRERMLCDLEREQFCVLLGRAESYRDGSCVNVVEICYPDPESYVSHGLTHVSPSKAFIYQALRKLQERADVDTVIDVHTHPFAPNQVSFSSIDDRDEEKFMAYLDEKFPQVHYLSIVLSQQSYDARAWEIKDGEPRYYSVPIRTQVASENISQSNVVSHTTLPDQEVMARTILALGTDTMSELTSNCSIVIIGVGGLGSAIAENLVHMGFNNLVLVDHDIVEKTNLNRIVGAKYEDAEKKCPKVEAMKRHLDDIIPTLSISTIERDIEDVASDAEIDSRIAEASFIVVATDNHLSRLKAQELAFRYFIPLVSAGVNITVEESKVTNYSGSVILARMGDRICLSCLGILDPMEISYEKNRENMIGEHFVKKGYVTGEDIKHPAVKTLNAVLASLAVEEIVNLFSNRRATNNYLEYDDTNGPSIRPLDISQFTASGGCFTCDI